MTYLAKELNKAYLEDIDDIIEAIESSFDITLDPHELIRINSIRELSELICKKIDLAKKDSCTTQLVFYKFRKAYKSTQHNPIHIHPQSLLEDIFPKKNRKQHIASIEKELNITLNILQPPSWLSISLLVLFIASLLLFFNHPFFGITGIIISSFCYYIASKTANTFSIKTVKELVRLVVKTNYKKSRNSDTFNPKEVEGIVMSYFIEDLGLDPNKFNPTATFTPNK